METNLSRETNVRYNSPSQSAVIRSQQNHSHKHEIPFHLWAFFVSIALTALAFAAVAFGAIENSLVMGMFILLLAIIQVVFQLLVWMHMNQKGHEYPITFIVTGVFVAVITVAALMLLIWW